MLTPRELSDRYSDSVLKEEFPDQQITSLRDIQRLYGKLYVLATADSGEYASFFTPDAANDIIGDENSLIVVRADLSSATPQLDPDNPVEFREYTDDLINKVGHCYYARKGSGVEHSISHKTGTDKDRTDIIGYAEDRLNRWTTEDPVLDVADTHKNGWIIEDLITLGRNKDQLKELGKEIYWNFGQNNDDNEDTTDDSDDSTPLKEQTTRAIVTVRVKTEPHGDYKWPAELNVLNEGMKAQRKSKLVSKNAATNSTGTATGYVTDEKTSVVGTADDPLNHFLTKQQGGFPGLDPDEAWRNHPISEETAILINKASTFIEACKYETNNRGVTFGANVYYLPYITTPITPTKIRNLYALLYRLTTSDENNDFTPLVRALEGNQEVDPENLRFYISTIEEIENARYNSLGSRLNCRTQYPKLVADTHADVLNSWLFENDSFVIGDIEYTVSSPTPKQEKWSLLNTKNLLSKVANGSYLFEVMNRNLAEPEKQDENTDYRYNDDQAKSDDERITMLIKILAGEQISYDTLLSEYVNRIEEDEDVGVPDLTVASQYAQLVALETAGLLRDSNGQFKIDLTKQPTTHDAIMSTRDTDDNSTDEDSVSTAEIREYKLEEYLNNVPWADNAQKRGVFLIGALIGQVSTYQRTAEDVSKTLIKNYPVSGITTSRLQRITQEALDKTFVYSDVQGLNQTMYDELITRIVETTGQHPPSEYTLPTNELKFFYSIGVAYGQNNWVSQEDYEEDHEDPPESTPTQ